LIKKTRRRSNMSGYCRRSKVSKTVCAAVLAACVGTVWAATPAPACKKEAKTANPPVTVVGEVVAVNADDAGVVTQAGVWTDSIDYFVIALNDKGKELCKAVGRRVELTGAVKPAKDEDSDSEITVASYKALPQNDQEAEAKAAPAEVDEDKKDDEGEVDWQ